VPEPSGKDRDAGIDRATSSRDSADAVPPRPADDVSPRPADDVSPPPADDPGLFDLGLDGLEARWARNMSAAPIGAEAMRGADRRAQAMGVESIRLMEHAGCAVAAAARALVVETGRWGHGPILVLSGPGNNGGDGFVAARHLSRHGARVLAVLVASDSRPAGKDPGRNWDRLEHERHVERIHTPVARDISILGQGIEKAALVIDALLGTGGSGPLRDPIRSAVELIARARSAGVPVLAVDTPTAVDLTSGDLSDPVVRAHVTVTFHRPKTGLLTRRGKAVAGRVLVAPIGIPAAADRG
jgi:hydroxyethylthiazole kinase-like uncharacterized protein yjeF